MSAKPPISFSIVIEAFTLTPETVDNLRACLESLDRQSLSPQAASEVLLMNTGQVDRTVLERIADKYEWLRIVDLPPGTRYFGAKMAGVRLATGDVLVFVDADNTYMPQSLESMITPFAERPELNILTGQTSVLCDDLASTLFGLTFFFPPFDPDTALEPGETYFANNAALRRQFLLEHPIEVHLPLLRGNDYVHSYWLRQQGHTIWRQTGSRAYHDAPGSAKEFLLRYLARGSDRLEIWRQTGGAHRESARGRAVGALPAALAIIFENLWDFTSRIYGVARQSPKALLYYPLALPIGAGLLVVVMVGIGYSFFRPQELVNRYIAAFHSVPRGAAGAR